MFYFYIIFIFVFSSFYQFHCVNRENSENSPNKSAKLTQNTPVVLVVNSMVMTTFLGAGYSTWRADTADSVCGQFKGYNSVVPVGIWQVIELGRNIMPTNIFTKFDKDRMKTSWLRKRKTCGRRPPARPPARRSPVFWLYVPFFKRAYKKWFKINLSGIEPKTSAWQRFTFSTEPFGIYVKPPHLSIIKLYDIP